MVIDGPEMTLIVKACVPVPPALSVTCTVKLDWPDAVGFPEMTPPVLSDNPAGSEPVETDHVYPFPDPPLAVNVVEVYDAPTSPWGKVTALMLGPWFTVNVSDGLSAVALVASVTLKTTGGKVDAVCDSVPVIAPVVGFSAKLAGSAPLLMDQVYGGDPPVAARVAPTYCVPASPDGSDEVVTVNGGGRMLIEMLWVPVPPAESVTVTLKLKLPANVGVPLTVPVGPPVNVSPGGGALACASVYDPVPPVPLSV